MQTCLTRDRCFGMIMFHSFLLRRMKTDHSIFGLRFEPNENLGPSPDELNRFLGSPKKPGSREMHGNDLGPYRKTLEEIAAFRDGRRGSTVHDLREKMLYGVLGHSSFFNAHLKSAVELYKYHVHSLALDFRKPAGLVRTNKGGKEKPSGTGEVTDGRKATIEELKMRRAALIRELCSIARYIRDNLARIIRLCETAIVVLVQLQIEGNEDHRLIEDIKTRFKGDLKNALRRGGVTERDLAVARRDVTVLSQEISGLLRDDVFALTALYEAIHDHARTSARHIADVITVMENKKNKSAEEELRLLLRLEQTLIRLVSEYHFPMKAAPARSVTSHQDILLEKRAEMLDGLFTLLRKDRRSQTDRRSGMDRRKGPDPNYKGPERRRGGDRRSGKNRRRSEDRF